MTKMAKNVIRNFGWRNKNIGLKKVIRKFGLKNFCILAYSCFLSPNQGSSLRLLHEMRVSEICMGKIIQWHQLAWLKKWHRAILSFLANGPPQLFMVFCHVVQSCKEMLCDAMRWNVISMQCSRVQYNAIRCNVTKSDLEHCNAVKGLSVRHSEGQCTKAMKCD